MVMFDSEQETDAQSSQRRRDHQLYPANYLSTTPGNKQRSDELIDQGSRYDQKRG